MERKVINDLFRGVGELKILKHKKNGLVRLIVRADATHKCILNHLLQQKEILCKLEPLKTSSTATAWTWACYDISDDKPQAEKMCVKFTNKDDFEKFRVEFEKGCADTALALSKKEQKTEEPVAETKKENPPAPVNA